MKAHVYILLGMVFFAAGALVFFFDEKPSSAEQVIVDWRAEKLTLLLERLPARIVAGMSLPQKVGQLIHAGIAGKRVDRGARALLLRSHAGGVILFERNLGSPLENRKLTGEMRKLTRAGGGIPPFLSTDQEGGMVSRIGPDATPQFPGAMALGQTEDPELAREVGFRTGYDLRHLGINLMFAPVMDVHFNPDNPVIRTRSFGSDPELVAKMATSHSAGIREARNVPVVKHFPGHGDTDLDSHLALPRVGKTREELARDILPFRTAIAAGAEVVMTAHILYTALDVETPAT